MKKGLKDMREGLKDHEEGEEGERRMMECRLHSKLLELMGKATSKTADELYLALLQCEALRSL